MAAVSVLLPFRNAETTLGECLDSILDQTLEDFELLADPGLSIVNFRYHPAGIGDEAPLDRRDGPVNAVEKRRHPVDGLVHEIAFQEGDRACRRCADHRRHVFGYHEPAV